MSDNYWDRIADLWRLFGPPIRPAADDLVVYQEIVDRATALIDGPPRVLLLGVTPELYRLRWPADAEVLALDSSSPMLEAVWQGPADTAVTGSWTAMPFADQSFTLLLCDAGVGLLDPVGQGELLAEVQRVLVPDGTLAVRLFAPQGRTGTVAEIFEDLDRGRLGMRAPCLEKGRKWCFGDARQRLRSRTRLQARREVAKRISGNTAWTALPPAIPGGVRTVSPRTGCSFRGLNHQSFRQERPPRGPKDPRSP